MKTNFKMEKGVLQILSISHFPFSIHFSGIWRLASFGLLLTACNNPETVPGQLLVEHFTVTDTNGAPVPDVDIRDVWVYVGGQILGVFPLPANIPLPVEGRKDIKLYPGIISDGVQGQRVQYAFYNAYIDTINFNPSTRLSLNPTVTLFRGIRRPYPFQENFEGNILSVDSGVYGISRVQTVRHPDPAPAWGGQFYGRVDALPADSNNRVLEITQKLPIPLSASGRPIFFEFHYKSSSIIQVGFYGVTATGNAVGPSVRAYLQPSSEWKMAYIYLTNNVIDVGSGYTFRLTCRAAPDSISATYLAVDNLKLLQYK